MSRVSLAQVLERIFLPQPLDGSTLGKMSDQEVEMALRAYGVDPREAFTLALPTVAALHADGVQAQLQSLGADVEGYLARATQLVGGHTEAVPAPIRTRRARWPRALAASVLVVVSATIGLMVVEQELPWRESVGPQPMTSEAGRHGDSPAPRPGAATPAAAIAPEESKRKTAPEPLRERAAQSVLSSDESSFAPPAPDPAVATRARPTLERDEAQTTRGMEIPPEVLESLEEPAEHSEGSSSAVGETAQPAPSGKIRRAAPSTPALGEPPPSVASMRPGNRRAEPERPRQRPGAQAEADALQAPSAVAAVKKSARGLVIQDTLENQSAATSGESRGGSGMPAGRSPLSARLRVAGLSPADERAIGEALRARRFTPAGPPRVQRNERGEIVLTFTASDGARLRLVREREGRWWDAARREELSHGDR